MSRPLINGYCVEVDAVEPRAWYEQVARFADANLYQLWQHGSGSERFTSVSRIVLKDASDVVAAAEVRLLRPPLMKRGIAYVLWGPLCEWNDDPRVFRQAIRAMRNEYVSRRGMILRMNPRLFEQNTEGLRALAEEGFSPVAHVRTKRTLIIDLDPSLDELRRDLDKKWRNCLSKAERSNLTVSSGTSLELFDRFIPLYVAMLGRKRLAPAADIQKHRRIQAELPEHLKMRVVLACHEGEACAGAIYTALGDTAVYLFGGTDATGMRTSASYLVQWEIVKALKESGVGHYDLNGIDPVSNPGTYHFKQGLAGKKGREVAFAGQFQAADRSLASYSLLALDTLRLRIRSARAHRVTDQK